MENNMLKIVIPGEKIARDLHSIYAVALFVPNVI